ncbi:hypothetical protein F4778DRAFT_131203 [Xylariomycetidae sp. FL2044]|nr:hypothetical protein F4778DRAFT_131203 [Xylariomycetidae sp. FL2044]
MQPHIPVRGLQLQAPFEASSLPHDCDDFPSFIVEMDPISAIGVAAAGIQFLDASLKALIICKEIRDSGTGSTHHNKELEQNARTIRSCRKELMAPVAGNKHIPRRILDIATKCDAKTDELIQVLEHVRGAGKGIHTAKATLRAMKGKRTIEKLQNSMNEMRTALDQALVQDLWTRVNTSDLEQSSRFNGLDRKVQTLLMRSMKQSGHFVSLDKKVQKLVVESEKQGQMINASQLVVRHKLSALDRKVQQGYDHSESIRRQEKILQSLFFPEINERRNNIKDPAPDTLKWVCYLDYVPDFESRRSWADFGLWLREDDSTYWICGKAGSGKSTLMAHLEQAKETRQNLEIWSQGHSLRMLSFFFWRPGSQLPKSISGLLRSLLYQVLQQLPIAVNEVFARLSIHADMIPTWTERLLSDVITTTLQAFNEDRFCIFIDGLDEFSGDHDVLVDLVFRLQDFSHVKCCVSSRPEKALTTRLEGLKQLRLEDLNYDDISKFVEQKLECVQLSRGVRTDMIWSILDGAEGVFLWASLVTQSIIRGAKAGDDEATLLRRLKASPKGMDELFEQMLQNVDEFHMESLAFYLQCMRLEKIHKYTISVSILTAARTINDSIGSQGSFTHLCEQTETQILAHSAGLLEVREFRRGDFPPDEDDLRSAWERSSIKFTGFQCAKVELHNRKLDDGFATSSRRDFSRRRCSSTEPYPSLLRYERRKMEWVHRSAYDFIFNTDLSGPLANIMSTIPSMSRQIMEGFSRYLAAAPSCESHQTFYPIPINFKDRPIITPSIWMSRFISVKTLTYKRFEYYLFQFNKSYEAYPMETSSSMDILYDIVSRLDPEELNSDLLNSTVNNISGDTAFWIASTQYPHFGSYALSRKDRLLSSTEPEVLFAALLAGVCFHRQWYVEHPLWMALEVLEAFKEILPNRAGERMMIAPQKSYGVVLEMEHGVMRSSASWHKPLGHDEVDTLAVTIAQLVQRFTSHPCFAYHEMKERDERLVDLLRHLPLPKSLYISTLLPMRYFFLHLSLDTWRSLLPFAARSYGSESAMVSVLRLDRPLRVVFLPCNRHDDLEKYEHGVGELRGERLVVIHPSKETIVRLLKLIGLFHQRREQDEQDFARESDEHFTDVYEFLAEDIKAEEHGLDATQQLFAKACAKMSLLYPNDPRERFVPAVIKRILDSERVI